MSQEDARSRLIEAGLEGLLAAGFNSTGVADIVAAAGVPKGSFYYYFDSKEGLYLAVLEEAYRRMRSIEAELQLGDLPPEAALRRLVEFTFDHHFGNQDYIRLVMSENMQRGEYLAQSKIIQELNVTAIDAIRQLYERGVAEGLFRTGLDAIDIHASISALTFFNVSNQHTFGLIFKHDPAAEAARALRRSNIVEMIVRFVKR